MKNSETLKSSLPKQGNEQIQNGSKEFNMVRKHLAIRIKADPSDVSNWCNFGIFLDQNCNYKTALFCFEKVTKLQPDCSFISCKKAMILDQLGRSEEALSWIDSLVRKNDKEPAFWFHKGIILLNKNSLDEAKMCFEAALKLDENLPEAWVNLGNVYERFNKLEKALSCYDKAFKINPDLRPANLNLMYILDKLGRLNEFLEKYGKYPSNDQIKKNSSDVNE